MFSFYNITRILLSPKVSVLVDETTAREMVSHLDDMCTQPSNDLTFDHGPAKSWGIELAADDTSNRTYRVAFIVEDRSVPSGETYLTMIAIEEGAQLELPPEKRAQLEGWKVYVAT